MNVRAQVIQIGRPGSDALLRWVAFAAIYLIWGSTFLAIRVTVTTIPPVFAAGARVLVAGAILYAVMRLRGGPAPSLRDWCTAVVSGFLLFAGCHGTLGWAEQHVTSGLAALLTATISLWTVLLASLGRTGKKPNARVVLGLVIGFSGLLALLDRGGGKSDMTASLALVAGAFSWAAGSLYARGRLVPGSPLLAAAMQMLAGGVSVILLSGVLGEWGTLVHAHISARSLGALAYLIVFGSIVAFGAYVWLLHCVAAASVSTYAFVNPIVALFLGWVLGGETVTARMLSSTVLIVAAIILITYQPARGHSR